MTVVKIVIKYFTTTR